FFDGRSFGLLGLGRSSLLRRLLRRSLGLLGLGGRLLRGGFLGRLVIMVVIVAAARAVDVAVLGLDRRLEVGAARLAVGDIGGAEQEVDDLVLEQRRAQLGGGHRLVADIFDEAGPVLRLVLLRRLHHQLVHFLL